MRTRLHAWSDARARRQDTQTWDHANLYVLPTRAGGLYALTLLAMLVGAINFQLQLGHALVFLLGSVAAVSIWQTHAALRGLRLEVQAVPDAPAGATAALHLRLCNDGPQRCGLRLGWREGGAQEAGRHDRAGALPPGRTVRPTPAAPLPVVVEADTPSSPRLDLELAPGEQRTLTLHHRSGPRGHHLLPTIEISTTYPYGLFRCWGWMRPARRRIVHPAPEQPAPPWPQRRAPGDDHARHDRPHGPAAARDTEEPDLPRDWRPGDRPREVLWKHYARSQRLLVRARRAPPQPPADVLTLADAAGASPGTAHGGGAHRASGPAIPPGISPTTRPASSPVIDAATGPATDPALEAALSRLCAWLLQAAREGRPVRLQLPGRPALPVGGTGTGEAGDREALAAALRALALHGLTEPPQ
ncbi:DUF58 domain-containing protein [Pseudaquabacterium rugosum]|uniref:DUF58 domain-containing protein n=1 Tax=Pseudaquabacterium rugosum TaxID=2984194 RepID=A0ABU9B9Y4_9BURK